jgi:hypothetical protein
MRMLQVAQQAVLQDDAARYMLAARASPAKHTQKVEAPYFGWDWSSSRNGPSVTVQAMLESRRHSR